MYFIISNLCIINSNNTSKYQSNMIREGVLGDSSECVNRCRPMYSNIKVGILINFFGYSS